MVNALESMHFDEVKQRVLKAFSGCIGQKNAITPKNLFKKVYGVKPEGLGPENVFFLQRRLHSAMISLKRSHYFLVCSVGFGSSVELFIPKDRTDFEKFKGHIESKRKMLNASLKECATFIQQREHIRYGKLKMIE